MGHWDCPSSSRRNSLRSYRCVRVFQLCGFLPSPQSPPLLPPSLRFILSPSCVPPSFPLPPQTRAGESVWPHEHRLQRVHPQVLASCWSWAVQTGTRRGAYFCCSTRSACGLFPANWSDIVQETLLEAYHVRGRGCGQGLI